MTLKNDPEELAFGTYFFLLVYTEYNYIEYNHIPVQHITVKIYLCNICIYISFLKTCFKEKVYLKFF